MDATKPAVASRTNQSAFTIILIALWVPLCLAVGAVAGLLGVDLDAASWVGYGDDDVISKAEWLAIVRDLVIATLAYLAIRFRNGAFERISGLFRTGS